MMIPYGKVTVVTGVSGGKSSLAFDTIYAGKPAEIPRKYVSCGTFSVIPSEKPDFDQISGLPPAIAISQNRINRNPRSTVGTATIFILCCALLFANI